MEITERRPTTSDDRYTTTAERAADTFTYARAESTVTIAVNPISSVCGRSMTFTATVSPVPPSSGIPTGTVTFGADDSPATPVTLCGGSATFTTLLNAGLHTVTASYAGDADFHASPLATLTTRIWRAGF
jgi:hypothetical protein